MSKEETTIQEAVSLDVQAWRQQLVQGILGAAAIFGFLAAVAGSYDSYLKQDLWTLPFYWGSYGTVLLFVFWRRGPYAFKAWASIGMLYVLGIVDFAQDPAWGSGRVFMLIVPFLATLFFGRREGILTLLLAFLTTAGFAVLFSLGLISPPPASDIANFGSWVPGIMTLLMLGVLIVVSLGYLVPRFTVALEQSQQSTRELKAYQTRLEEQVSGRTMDLERRTRYLEATTAVAREAASVLDLHELLGRVVNLVSEEFDFYHTGIFLIDEPQEWAVLEAASSEGGWRMLARRHRLRVGEEGIVGYVTGRGEPRIALDVGEDAVYFDNPDMPETRSEMALPLRARGEIIGALDVQSKEPEAFGDEDVAVLQALADQVAVAISNARLFEQVEESIEIERRAYGEITRRAWSELFRTTPEMGEQYDPQGILKTEGWREEMEQAAKTGEPIQGQGASSMTFAIPIKVRDQVIGVLDAHKSRKEGEWVPEEVVLLEALSDQLGVALESARLYRDTQRQASREQLIGEITAQVRQTMDVDTILQTAAREIGDRLGLAEVVIRVGVLDDGGGE